MKKFENDVQKIKYKVLKEVASLAFKGTLQEEMQEIPDRIIEGNKARFRCCIYKEKAIIEERVKLALGGQKKENKWVEVIDIACDECPIDRFTVTEACRGCLAHHCQEVCPANAIIIIDQRSYINQEKCIECGRCKKSCPYDAISERVRPCNKACGVGAITIDEKRKASIDYDKCIQCGACVYRCPFGAIEDRSSIVDVVEKLRNKKKQVFALVAPAISSQFPPAKIGQVVTAIKKLGFHDVIEVALGADIVAYEESKEFATTIEDRGTLTTSCCPSFVELIYKNYPTLTKHISTTVSPMVAIGRMVKNMHPHSEVVFFGPCIAKKMEAQKEDVKDAIDYVLTFEELNALLDGAGIDIEECDEDSLDNASYYGRIFARSGGVSQALEQALAEQNLQEELRAIQCQGVDECNKALKILKAGKLEHNVIEGMICQGGCIGGPSSLTHKPKDKNEVDKYAKLAMEKSPLSALRIFDLENIHLHRNHNEEEK
ncbi:4Fe-4S dicluster domain-containing protein [Irregularibacter muris]|uniref:4Fe-4S dicluster domain-containing protein n=1 Tax=Irregularibacter muris TaxID=1796619 RepID=A0AAE3KYW5_9FIRM|nr:4Fe-4S dicluster domain-containing protein [Irregularibacter muris]MCR1897706.1 4Fe-4S dicluster domain-containing protein [Irregularibacter muris]